MKKLMLISSLFLIASVSAEEVETADTLKLKSLESCQASANKLDGQDKVSALAVCQCVSERTDYQLLLDAKKAGEMAPAEQHIDETVKACKEESAVN